MTNNMGCSFLLMAAVALGVGFIPILNWITLFIALPLALLAATISGLEARKNHSQQADKTFFWISIAMAATILLRTVVL